MTEEILVKTLLEARARLIAGFCTVVRDIHQAEDVFQEVLLRALKMPESFDEPAGLLAWARVSGRNRAIDHIRRAGRLGEILSELALDAVEDRLEHLAEAGRPRLDAMRACIAALPEESRRLLRLRYEDRLKGREVAHLLHRSEDAIYKALSRLHQALRRCIEERLRSPASPP